MLRDIEQRAIEGHFASADFASSMPDDPEQGALFLGLRLALEAGQLVRQQRTILDPLDVIVKGDGSPATRVEEAIESRLRELLHSLDSEVVVVGEETGGTLPGSGLAVAIDPIDGTWAFLSDSETYCTTVALIQDRETLLGMVSNPVTGEIAYATASGDARLIRLPLFGEATAALALGSRPTEGAPPLVHLHPSRQAGSVMGALYAAWERNDIHMVRSTGGSPAWALVEAARGHFTYANLWSERAAEAYDLAAGVLVVRRAQGEVVDLAGRSIDPIRHSGPFVAGASAAPRARVIELVQQAL